MTEADAKTKWCPFVRVAFQNGSLLLLTNRGEGYLPSEDTDKAAKCIAANCMAWRFSNYKLGHNPSHKGAEAAAAFKRENPLHGFCGLAGQPS